MNESRKEGLGLMILPTGQTILGRWYGNTINGVFRCPQKAIEASRQHATGESILADQKPGSPASPPFHIQNLNSSHEGAGPAAVPGKALSKNQDSQSRLEAMKRTAAFNKVPIEVRGHFEIQGESLLLMDSGSIRFEDGSVYTGGILNNKMSGYGSLKYASGEHCEGVWKNNHLTGLGFYSTDNFIYEGQFKNGVWHGFGKLTFNNDGRVIKGEWDTGKLKYAVIDEFEPNNNYLQVDRITVRVEDESNFYKSGTAELLGTAHVIFREKAMGNSKDGAASPSIRPEQMSSIAAIKEMANQSEEMSEQLVKSREKQSQSASSTHQFFGTFTRLEEKPTYDGFAQGQIVALGIIIKGSDVIFMGMADHQFSSFFGVKYDHETQTETKGYFNSNLKLNGIGAQSVHGFEYIGNFRKNHKHGLIIKIRDGATVLVGDYADDVKNGFALRFQEEMTVGTVHWLVSVQRCIVCWLVSLRVYKGVFVGVFEGVRSEYRGQTTQSLQHRTSGESVVGSIAEVPIGTTPRSTRSKATGALDSLGVKEGVVGILTEYSYGKLRKIFYALS